MGNLTIPTFGLLMFGITLGSFGQFCMKNGLREHPIVITSSVSGSLASVLGSVIQPWVLVGLGLYVVSVFVWMLLLSRIRLSVLYPMISISYVIVMLLSVWILHERVEWHYAVAGLAFIGAGVSFIGLGLGQGR